MALSFYRLPTDDNGIPTPATVNVSSLSQVKEKNINIVVRGGVKVNTSVGMAFPGYKTTDEYINRNDTIRVQPGSKYAPNIGAFVNFYPYTDRTLQLGGTFGVGVPLQAEQRDMNMFMGLSALLGCDSRVALHGGFSLGQVKKLDGGYNVGDSYVSSDLLVPTRNVWEWGSFGGISFNISKTGN